MNIFRWIGGVSLFLMTALGLAGCPHGTASLATVKQPKDLAQASAPKDLDAGSASELPAAHAPD